MAHPDGGDTPGMTGSLSQHNVSPASTINGEDTSVLDGLIPFTATTVPGIPSLNAGTTRAKYSNAKIGSVTQFKGGGARSFSSPTYGTQRVSIPESSTSSSLALPVAHEAEQRQCFRSRRLKEEERSQQPWIDKQDPREKWVTTIPLLGLAAGFGVALYLIVQGLYTVKHHNYQLVLDENWSTFDTTVWTKESNVGGFG